MDPNEEKCASAVTDEQTPPAPFCYLCSSIIAGPSTRDHAVPKGLIKREQPRAKGYEYGGFLPTHPECNNRFGPEAYAAKAMDLLRVRTDPRFMLQLTHPKDPSIRIATVNADLLPHFTEADLRHFGMMDGRDTFEQAMASPAFFKDKKKSNPVKRALQTSLSVLAKSAAALLFTRFRIAPPARWQIVAFPYSQNDANSELNFDEEFGGPSKPFDDGLQLWIKPLDDGNYFAIYKARGPMVFFLFVLGDMRQVLGVRARFADVDHYYFEGRTINSMLITGWSKLPPLPRDTQIKFAKQGR